MPPLFHPVGSAANLTSPIESIKRTLHNKSILVTGGASGFGAAMAKDFAEAGCVPLYFPPP
jgi:FlaA1/EpsC-like NDP-sugar epimerase